MLRPQFPYAPLLMLALGLGFWGWELGICPWGSTRTWAQPTPEIVTPPRDQETAPVEEPDRSWQQISRRGRLRVGIDPSLGEAYLYVDPKTQTYDGFEWDILQTLARRLEVELDPVYVPWSLQFESLRQEEVDLIWGARESLGLPTDLAATRPYLLSPQRLVVPADPPAEAPERLSQLFGLKVGVVVDSTGAALLETYNHSRGNAIRLFATSDPQRLFDQLRSGQLDAVVVDQPVAVAAVAEAGAPLQMRGPALVPIPLVGVVLSEHPSLKQAVDRALLDLQQDGSLERILEEWQLWDSATLPSSSAD